MRWCLVWEAATRSRNLDTNTRLVIALKFARCSFSDEALLNLGRRRPSLSALGKTPSRSDVFIIVVMIGRSSSKQALSVRVGIGSHWHDFDGNFPWSRAQQQQELVGIPIGSSNWEKSYFENCQRKLSREASYVVPQLRNFVYKMPTEPFSQFLNRRVTRNNRGRFNLTLNMPSMTSP